LDERFFLTKALLESLEKGGCKADGKGLIWMAGGMYVGIAILN
jgi:hypothetical protein